MRMQTVIALASVVIYLGSGPRRAEAWDGGGWGSGGTLLKQSGENLLPDANLDPESFLWDSDTRTLYGIATAVVNVVNEAFPTCSPLTNVEYQTDCADCNTHYADGAVGSPSGTWVDGCDTNNPNLGDIICRDSYDSTYGSGSGLPAISRTCWVWNGAAWVETDLAMKARGNFVMNGNIINMDGWGTNILAAGVTGCILTGTNNGTIYVGSGSHGNTIMASMDARTTLTIGTNSVGNIIQYDALMGADLRLDNNVRLNKLAVYAGGGSDFRLRGRSYCNTISISDIDGGPYLGFDGGGLTNCVISAGGIAGGIADVMWASNSANVCVMGLTNIGNRVNEFIHP